MENVNEFIKPELLALVPVLYIIGLMIKNTELIKDKFIPIILGTVGVVLSILYVMAVAPLSLTGLYTGITQGILVAGVAVYVNQLIVQTKK